MKNNLLLIVLLFQTILGIAQINHPIGINISDINDYSTEFVFTDAMKQSREWISYNEDGTGPWNTNLEVPLQPNGYPTQIPYSDGINLPQKVRTLMLWDLPNDAFPSGNYRLIVSGSGTVRLKFGATGVFNTPIDTLIFVNNGVALEIEYSDVNDPINKVQFIRPEYINTFQTKTFTDEFVNFLSEFDCIRYMGWLRTNGSNVENWEQRSTPDYYTQATKNGVAWEYIIELSNLVQKDLWINIPHKADDNYMMQLALMLMSGLNSDLKIYLEFSNEVWNSAFPQHQETALLAENLGYTGQEWERAWKYTAKRSADLFYTFNNVFTDEERLIKIIPSQAANSWLSNQLVTYFIDPIYNPYAVSADALAIAPYFAGSVANQIVAEGLVSSITIEEIVNRMELSLPEVFNRMQQNQLVANNHSLDLLTYEGGQHLVATGSNVNIAELTQKLNEANRHPNLEDVYCQYFNHWSDNYGGLFMHFASHGKYTKWGSWGLKETMIDDYNPKYLALQNCVFPSNSLSNSEIIMDENTFIVFPNPTNELIIIKKYKRTNEAFEYIIVDFTGRMLKKGNARFNERIDIESLRIGNYIIRIKTENGKKFTKKLSKK